ncbi:polysaccharide deacetylase family protein [Marinobacter alexandrii]|uniref:polysaccharide deacetylase family protein n=1 Tax=Marinobacter alexandrii TaxID=2570351 RepID=UPI0032661F2E
MTLNQFVYRASRPLGSLKLARFLSRNHPKILMYHRITDDLGGDGLAVTQFRKHIEIIKKYFFPMTLRDLLAAHENGSVPKNAVVITFDDGYADFADLAFPILEKEKVPATLFVTTGFVNGDIWLWPDQIKYAVENAGVGSLDVPEINQKLNFEKEPHRCWNAIADFCITVPNERKLKFIDELFYRLKVAKPNVIPDEFRPLSWTQIKSMVEKGLDVGSHSISHPILTQLSDDELARELRESGEMLRDEVNMEVDIFCYPNGSKDDFDRRVQDCITHSGYRYAVSAFPDKMPISDKLCINRYPVGPKLDMFEKNIFGFSYLAMMT